MHRHVPILVALACGLALAAPAAAEGFLDVYGGGAFTQDDSATLGTFGTRLRTNARFENSPVLGGRLGLWLKAIPVLGGAIDVSAYNADGEDGFDPTDIDVYPLSALVMVRVPLLEEDDFPDGRVQPYAALGPSLVVSNLQIPAVFDETTADLGVDARLGVTGMLTERVGFFFEWRYLHFEPNYENRISGAPVRFGTEIGTHFLQAGISLRF